MTVPPPLAMTMGDPAGCGPAITQATWKHFRTDPAGTFYVRGDPSLYDGVPTIAIDTPHEANAAFADGLPVIALDEPLARPTPGSPDIASAPAIIASISACVRDAMNSAAGGVVTNPIAKSLLAKAGFPHPGHTEFIAAECARDGYAPRPIMMLVGGGLRVALATIHLPLRDAVDALSVDHLTDIAHITNGALQRDFGFPSPRLAFTGLNPHAGEDGMLGREEIEIINPTAAKLRAAGLNISDARPADTVYAEALMGQFDGVIAMTHDQGLIPVKTLDLWGGVNTTLGLPIVRTSPDHGTAYDAARLGTARPDSLIAAVNLAVNMCASRANAAP